MPTEPKKAPTKTHTNKRNNSLAFPRLLWAESNNQCPICYTKLGFPIGKYKSEYKLMGGSHCAVIAHIITHSTGSKAPKQPKSFKEPRLLRSRKNKYTYPFEFMKSTSNAHFQSDKEMYNDEGWTDDYVESFFNKVLLCLECSQKVDGKKLNTKKDSIDFFDNFMQKTDEEQIESMMRLKSLIKNNAKISEQDNNQPFHDVSVTSIDQWKNLENCFNFLGVEATTPIRIDSFSFEGSVDDEVYEFITEIDSSIPNVGKLYVAIDSQKLKSCAQKFFKKIDENKKKQNSISIKMIHSRGDHKDARLVFKYINLSKNTLDRRSFNEFQSSIEKEAEKIETKWISNDASPNGKELNKKPEYKVLKELLLTQLKNHSEKNDYSADFNSFSLAYMARWGTGKTTIIRNLYDDLKKYFNFVEINLWHIANGLDSERKTDQQDDTFVRMIVKEAITQLSGNPDLVSRYIDSTKKVSAFQEELDVKKQMLDSLLQLPSNSKPSTIILERAKFLDQYISLLSRVTNVIFKNSYKPTVFVFDDLDRIDTEENTVKILDSLVAFLNIKNAVYIIPVDEAKVMKAISKTKKGKDPYSFMNKYFTYSIRAPFMPRLNTKKILEDSINEWQLNTMIQESLIKKMSSLVPSTYRGMKDFMNAFQSNEYILRNNAFIKSLTGEASQKDNMDIFMVATILQIQAPLFVDFLASDLRYKDVIFNLCEKKDGIVIMEKVIDALKNNAAKEKNKQKEGPDKEKEGPDKEKEKNKEDYIDTLLDSTDHTSNIKLWSSLINKDLKNITIDNVATLVEVINDAIESKEENTDIGNNTLEKNLLIERLSFIKTLFDEFEMKKKTSKERLIFWTSVTMATIEDSDAQEFAKEVGVFDALTLDEPSDALKKIKEIDELDLKEKENKDSAAIEEELKHE